MELCGIKTSLINVNQINVVEQRAQDEGSPAATVISANKIGKKIIVLIGDI